MENALLDIRTTPAGVRVLLEEEVERLSGALRYVLFDSLNHEHDSNPHTIPK